MLGKRVISLIMTLSVSASCLATVYAEKTGSDIKKYLLMDENSSFDSGMDLNSNGTADVFDLCRYKRQIIEGNIIRSKTLIYCGEPVADYSNRTVTVPVLLDKNSYGIDAAVTYMSYNKEYFSFSTIEPGTIAGGFKFSLNTTAVMYSNDYDDNLDRGGILYSYVFNMENVVPEGNYTFSLFNVAAASYRTNPEGENLTSSQCPENSAPVMIKLSQSVGNDSDHSQEEHYSDYPGLDAQTVTEKLMAFEPIYPDGTPWTNDNSYKWQGSPIIGYGCAAFAFMLSDAAFGKLPARKHYDVTKIKTGDILRVNKDTHSVIVIKVNENGVLVAEGNMNSAVRWGRKYTWEALKNDVSYIWTRYPE